MGVLRLLELDLDLHVTRCHRGGTALVVVNTGLTRLSYLTSQNTQYLENRLLKFGVIQLLRFSGSFFKNKVVLAFRFGCRTYA